MPFDFALPIASVIALLAAATYLGRPRIRMRTYNHRHGGLRVIEVALILTRAGRVGAPASAVQRQAAEFVIYMTLKTAAR